MEVKNISRDNMTKREEKELFAEFAEDYNTSTLPQSVKMRNSEDDIDQGQSKRRQRRDVTASLEQIGVFSMR